MTNKPNWLANLSTDTKEDVKPFSPNPYKPNILDYQGYLVIADRPNGGKKFNFALRIEEDINIEDCSISVVH